MQKSQSNKTPARRRHYTRNNQFVNRKQTNVAAEMRKPGTAARWCGSALPPFRVSGWKYLKKCLSRAARFNRRKSLS